MRPLLLTAAALRDAAGVDLPRPAFVLLEAGVVRATGPAEHAPDVGPDVERLDLPGHVVLPGLVNAHTHLELTAIGPRPDWACRYADGGPSFVDWIRHVRRERPATPAVLAAAVDAGVDHLRAAGVAAVGDVGGGGSPSDREAIHHRLVAAGLHGVSFAELLAQDGPRLRAERARIDATTAAHRAASRHADPARLRRGLQPHAPSSTSPALYAAAAAAAAEHGLPVCTHAAELPEEAAFVAHAAGPFRDLLEELGVWHGGLAAHYSGGLSPIRWLEPHLRQAPFLIAHVNHLSDDDLALLADTPSSVAYCPLASRYFGHAGPDADHAPTTPPHRYRDLLAAGVNVCLGTDSIVNADPADPQPLGPLSAARHLHARDGTPPADLLAMATVRGRDALGLPAAVGTLAPGAPARLAALPFDPAHFTDPLTQVMTRPDPVRVVDRLTAGASTP